MWKLLYRVLKIGRRVPAVRVNQPGGAETIKKPNPKAPTCAYCSVYGLQITGGVSKHLDNWYCLECYTRLLAMCDRRECSRRQWGNFCWARDLFERMSNPPQDPVQRKLGYSAAAGSWYCAACYYCLLAEGDYCSDHDLTTRMSMPWTQGPERAAGAWYCDSCVRMLREYAREKPLSDGADLYLLFEQARHLAGERCGKCWEIDILTRGLCELDGVWYCGLHYSTDTGPGRLAMSRLAGTAPNFGHDLAG